MKRLIEPSHLDLCCLQKPIIIACGSERVKSILDKVMLGVKLRWRYVLTCVSTEGSGGNHHIGESGLHRQKLHSSATSVGYSVLATVFQVVPLTEEERKTTVQPCQAKVLVIYTMHKSRSTVF